MSVYIFEFNEEELEGIIATIKHALQFKASMSQYEMENAERLHHIFTREQLISPRFFISNDEKQQSGVFITTDEAKVIKIGLMRCCQDIVREALRCNDAFDKPLAKAVVNMLNKIDRL